MKSKKDQVTYMVNFSLEVYFLINVGEKIKYIQKNIRGTKYTTDDMKDNSDLIPRNQGYQVYLDSKGYQESQGYKGHLEYRKYQRND